MLAHGWQSHGLKLGALRLQDGKVTGTDADGDHRHALRARYTEVRIQLTATAKLCLRSLHNVPCYAHAYSNWAAAVSHATPMLA